MTRYLIDIVDRVYFTKVKKFNRCTFGEVITFVTVKNLLCGKVPWVLYVKMHTVLCVSNDASVVDQPSLDLLVGKGNSCIRKVNPVSVVYTHRPIAVESC